MFIKTTIAALAVLTAPGASATANHWCSSPRAISVTADHEMPDAARDAAEALNAGAMLKRIWTVAHAACDAEPDHKPDHAQRYRTCLRVTVDKLVAALGDRRVTALNAQNPIDLPSTARR